MESSTAPFLSDIEVAGVCDGVSLPGVQKRHLRRMGIYFIEKPNGRPLVMRSELERVVGAARLGDGAAAAPAQNATGPNVFGLQQWAGKRKHGAQAKGR